MNRDGLSQSMNSYGSGIRVGVVDSGIGPLPNLWSMFTTKALLTLNASDSMNPEQKIMLSTSQVLWIYLKTGNNKFN